MCMKKRFLIRPYPALDLLNKYSPQMAYISHKVGGGRRAATLERLRTYHSHVQ